MDNNSKTYKVSKMSLDEYKNTQFMKIMNIFDFSSNLPASLYIESTGLRLSEALYRSCRLSNTRLLIEDYLLNAKKSTMDLTVPRGVSQYSSYGVRACLQQRQLAEEEFISEGKALLLPKYKNINAPLGVTIRSRRSIRAMSGKKLKIEDLSTILYYACGITGDYELLSEERGETDIRCLDMNAFSKVRSSPSGGGLYPIYLYIAIFNTQGLEDGLYVYLPLTHALGVIKIFDEKEKNRLYQMAEWGLDIDEKKVNFMIFYVYKMYENARKYGDMALLFALIESGQISQNIHLTSTALNLASCDIGGYEKVPLEKFLGIDGLSKHLVNLTLVGARQAESI